MTEEYFDSFVLMYDFWFMSYPILEKQREKKKKEKEERKKMTVFLFFRMSFSRLP